MSPCLRFLRPYSLQPLPAGSSSRCSAYLRFYELSRTSVSKSCRRKNSSLRHASDAGEYKPGERSALMTARLRELRPAGGLEYPRFNFQGRSSRISLFNEEFAGTGKKGLEDVQRFWTLHGRVLHIRRFGAKFFFLTIVDDGEQIQVMVNFGKLLKKTDPKEFKKMAQLIKRGDHISVSGGPARTDTGQLALEATLLPTLFSPSIAPLPFQIPEESRMQQRHLDLLLNRPARDILVLRQFIIAQLRKHLESTLSCLEVQTPILAANAGGATARPFSTHTADSEKQLALRIAPELWLKRLVVAGFDRVFELGQAFRNEGVDATHNPEFTVCEFYMAHANLDGLMNITQNMFYALAKAVDLHVKKAKMELQTPEPSTFEGAFEKVEFLPELEKALGQVLPDLNRPTAVLDIIKLLDNAGKDWHHSLPPNPSLPKLLDHLAGVVLEPRSLGRPLYIIHHPVCMSPLAKTFTCPKTGQQVAARAELFFDGKELANMYEEENDPFKQRRKLVSQAQTRLAQQGAEALADDDEPPHVIDEQYISVLESGLPPTAGWGCGVDRLVMLFTGAKRISDVLPFGNLRNVIGLASASLQPTSQQSQEDKAAANVGANIEESEKNVPSEVVMKKDIGIQIPKPSDFEALTAVSFLGIPMKGFPEANAEASTGEAMPAIRHATKTIEDETPYMDPVTAELMSSVEAGMKLGAQNAREPLDVDTDRRPSQGSFARRHVPSIIEDDTPLTDPIADHIFSIKARMEIGGQGEQETPGPNTDGKPSQITSAERRVEEALVMDSRVEETASAAAEVDKNTPGAVETAGPNTDGGPSRVTSVKRRVTQFIEDD